MGRTALALAAILLATAPVIAQAPYYLTTDAPQTLGGVSAKPSNALLNNGGTYSLELALPPRTRIGGLYRVGSGDWLFSIRTAKSLGGLSIEPRDVVEYDGSTYTIIFNGSAAGVPPGSKIDALTVTSAGDWIFSFDVPTTIAGNRYERADLVRYDTTLSAFDPVPYFDASAATPPIPSSRNVTGADLVPGLTLLVLNAPTRLGGLQYRPGQILSWDGAVYAIHEDPAGWPPRRNRHIAAFDFLPDIGPGEVTDLMIGKNNALTLLTLEWARSCSITAFDYGIYEGQILTWHSHNQYRCTDAAPFLEETIPMPNGSMYYLVVPLGNADEGSYGKQRSFFGVITERPVGSPATCRPVQTLGCP